MNYHNCTILSEYLKRFNVTHLINAAGFTGMPNVDACESSKHECVHGNAVLPGIIRDVCEDLRLPWGHVSSDIFIVEDIVEEELHGWIREAMIV